MSGWWQHLPEHLNPIFFSVGIFSVRWYAVCFMLGIGVMWLCLLASRRRFSWGMTEQKLEDMFFWVLVGSFLGARLGYAFWYAPAYFLAYPIQIFWPFDPVTGHFSGIGGLSFHGALLGAAMGMYWWTRANNFSFLVWADRWVALIPLGIIFGRLGNFFNGELWGRPTDVAWGMFFPGAIGEVLRHPSQLYEMFGEGVLLFLFLLWIGRKKHRLGVLTAWFLFSYGAIRFILEYWREPDMQIGFIGGIFSLGQILSLGLVIFGGAWLWQLAGGLMKMRKKYAILKRLVKE